MLDHVIAQASEHHVLDTSWEPLLGGLRLWQLWDADLPLSPWREEVVRWLYLDLPASRYERPIVLPDHHAELCTAHQLWIKSPLLLSIPLVCAGGDGDDWYWSTWHSSGPYTRLAQLFAPESHAWASSITPVSHPGQTVALATLVEYAVATYGRDRLPTLVAGLSRYKSWQSLIPDVFGVTAADFEAGWQAYLAAQYGVSPDAFQPDAPGGQSGENRE